MNEQNKADRLVRKLEESQKNSPRTDEEWSDLLMIADELQKTHSDAQPDPHFVTTLRSELIQKHPAAQGCVHTASKRKQSFLRYTVLLVACMVLIWMGSHFYDMETSQAEARAIISRMEQTSSLSSMDVTSYRAKITYTGKKADGTVQRSESLRWYRTQGQFRQETKVLQPQPFQRTIVASDGKFWSSDSQAVQVSIDQMAQIALDRLAGPYLGMEVWRNCCVLIRMHTLYSYSVKRE